MKIDWKHPFRFDGKYLSFLIIILGITFYIFLIDKGYIKNPLSPKTIIKEKTVKVPVKEVKYIEKPGMKTSEFVLYINPRVDPIIAEEIGKAVDKYSKEYNIPKKLILSIIKKESFCNPFERSKVAFGLMQIYPKFHKKKIEALGIKDEREIYHIDNNIHLGCWIFREYLDKSDGDLDETFHKYLSKIATEKQRDNYKNSILTTWAELEFIEFNRRSKQ